MRSACAKTAVLTAVFLVAANCIFAQHRTRAALYETKAFAVNGIPETPCIHFLKLFTDGSFHWIRECVHPIESDKSAEGKYNYSTNGTTTTITLTAADGDVTKGTIYGNRRAGSILFTKGSVALQMCIVPSIYFPPSKEKCA